jgi:hypothetical protein
MKRAHTIALTVLVAACGMILSQGTHSAMGSQQQHRKTEEFSVAREGARELRLKNPGGNLRFRAGEEGRIRVVAEKRVQSDDAREAEALLGQMTLSRRREGDRWIFEATWPKQQNGRRSSAHVNWEVWLPREMRLDAQTGGGNVEAEELAAARLQTGGGNVAVKRVAGALDLQTGGGNVSVQDAGETRVHTGGGNISASTIRGPLSLDTGGGNLEIERCAGAVNARTGGGNVELRGARGEVVVRTGAGNVHAEIDSDDRPTKAELNTGSGNIELRLLGSANAEVRAETGNGRVSLQPADGARFNSDRTRMETRLGGGAGSIRLNTGSGSVRIQLGSR